MKTQTIQWQRSKYGYCNVKIRWNAFIERNHFDNEQETNGKQFDLLSVQLANEYFDCMDHLCNIKYDLLRYNQFSYHILMATSIDIIIGGMATAITLLLNSGKEFILFQCE